MSPQHSFRHGGPYSSIVVDQINNSWRGLALSQMGVELTSIELDAKTVEAIRRAQADQVR